MTEIIEKAINKYHCLNRAQNLQGNYDPRSKRVRTPIFVLQSLFVGYKYDCVFQILPI